MRFPRTWSRFNSAIHKLRILVPGLLITMIWRQEGTITQSVCGYTPPLFPPYLRRGSYLTYAPMYVWLCLPLEWLTRALLLLLRKWSLTCGAISLSPSLSVPRFLLFVRIIYYCCGEIVCNMCLFYWSRTAILVWRRSPFGRVTCVVLLKYLKILVHPRSLSPIKQSARSHTHTDRDRCSRQRPSANHLFTASSKMGSKL